MTGVVRGSASEPRATSVFDDFRGHAEDEDGFELMVGDQRLQVFEEGGCAETLDA